DHEVGGCVARPVRQRDRLAVRRAEDNGQSQGEQGHHPERGDELLDQVVSAVRTGPGRGVVLLVGLAPRAHGRGRHDVITSPAGFSAGSAVPLTGAVSASGPGKGSGRGSSNGGTTPRRRTSRTGR